MVMKLAKLFMILFAVAFLVGGVVGFFVATVHADGIACGAPLKVIDGTYLKGVPASLHNECQDAANRWIGFMFPAFVLIAVDQRRRREKEPKLADLL